jgi:hypothetical protein
MLKNPDTKQKLFTWGLIDTGSDTCAIPATYAEILGHNLLKGKNKQITTGNGITQSYEHTTEIDIFGFDSNSIIKSDNPILKIPETYIDYMPNLGIPLLGVDGFLERYTLTINYPHQFFTLEF